MYKGFFKITSIIFVLSLATLKTNRAETAKEDISSCNGAFDVFFVLDLSSSLSRGIKNHFKDETVSFVKDLMEKFSNPLLRISFITFNTDAHVVMDLTSDRKIMERKLSELRSLTPDGKTKLGLGLMKVNEQIRSFGQKRASVVFILTDGVLDYTTKVRAVKEALTARDLGSTLFAVGVGDFDTKQLREIVGGLKQYVFQAASFNDLNRIVEQVVDSSCVEIVDASPNTVCENMDFELNIHGSGFNKAGDPSQVKCNYWLNETTHFLVKPTTFHSNLLICPSPKQVFLKPSDIVTIQVTLNDGISFISSNVTIITGVCTRSVGVLWTVIFMLALLVLMTIWWFWNVLFCVVGVKPNTNKKQTPPPRPSQPKTEIQQWPVVDASFYGGRGAGGMHPMRVEWGDRGCTEGAMHLERTSDAKEVAVLERPIIVNNTNKENIPKTSPIPNTCFNRIKNSLRKFFTPLISIYKRVSVRRPQSGEMGKCMSMKIQDNYEDHDCSSASGVYFDTSH